MWRFSVIPVYPIKIPLLHGETIRGNSLLYKNVTAAFHGYKGIVSYNFLQCTKLRVVSKRLIRDKATEV
jgi:hypothetical protein